MLYQVRVKKIQEDFSSSVTFEDQVNQWLAEHPDVTIMDIKYSQVALDDNLANVMSSVLIMYREFTSTDLQWPTKEEVHKQIILELAEKATCVENEDEEIATSFWDLVK